MGSLSLSLSARLGCGLLCSAGSAVRSAVRRRASSCFCRRDLEEIQGRYRGDTGEIQGRSRLVVLLHLLGERAVVLHRLQPEAGHPRLVATPVACGSEAARQQRARTVNSGCSGAPSWRARAAPRLPGRTRLPGGTRLPGRTRLPGGTGAVHRSAVHRSAVSAVHGGARARLGAAGRRAGQGGPIRPSPTRRLLPPLCPRLLPPLCPRLLPPLCPRLLPLLCPRLLPPLCPRLLPLLCPRLLAPLCPRLLPHAREAARSAARPPPLDDARGRSHRDRPSPLARPSPVARGAYARHAVARARMRDALRAPLTTTERSL